MYFTLAYQFGLAPCQMLNSLMWLVATAPDNEILGLRSRMLPSVPDAGSALGQALLLGREACLPHTGALSWGLDPTLLELAELVPKEGGFCATGADLGCRYTVSRPVIVTIT